MQVKMIVQMSGTRNGRPWPDHGQTLQVPDGEGADLCAAGVAEPVASKGTETATAPAAEERQRPTKGKRRADAG